MTEARTGSLYERIRQRGLLDYVFRALYDGEKDVNAMARWLKAEGIAASRSSVHALVKKHGWDWRHDNFRDAKKEHNLPEDDDLAADEILKRKIRSLTLEADSLKELRLLAQIAGDSKKDARDERKVQVLEKDFARKLDETRLKGAEFLDAIFSEAAKLEAARTAHAAAVISGAPVKDRLRQIINRVWGDQATA